MFEVGTKAAGIYKIRYPLGKGGTGNVYAVTAGEKLLAMKVCPADGLREERHQEAALLEKLHHRKIPQAMAAFEQGGYDCLVMEYRQGKTLEQRVLEQGGMKEEEVLRFGLELCRVLRYLHHRNPPVYYQDMKPSNVLLKGGHLEALVDFDCAREAGDDGNVRACGRGTRGYAPPEQFREGTVLTPGADVYGLGCTLRFALGREPVSEELRGILRRCTSARPQERPASIGEVEKLLRHCLLFGGGSRAFRKRISAVAVAAVLVLFLLKTGGKAAFQEAWNRCEADFCRALAGDMQTGGTGGGKTVPSGGAEEVVSFGEAGRCLKEMIFPGVTRETLLEKKERDFAGLLLEAGHIWWYQAGSDAGKLEGCCWYAKALESSALTDKERREAACYAGLLPYYTGRLERQTERAEEAVTLLGELRTYLLEQGRPEEEIQETETEILRAAYLLSDEKLQKEKIKSLLIEIKIYLKKEKQGITEEQQEKEAMLLDTIEQLLGETERGKTE